MTVLYNRRQTESLCHEDALFSGVYRSLGIHPVRYATRQQDTEYHIDFFALADCFPGIEVRIAERMRDWKYRAKYNDITQTLTQANGSPGEWYTSMADLLVYGWHSNGTVREAFLVDYRILRTLTSYVDKKGGGHDRRQVLRAWDITELENQGGVKAHWGSPLYSISSAAEAEQQRDTAAQDSTLSVSIMPIIRNLFRRSAISTS